MLAQYKNHELFILQSLEKATAKQDLKQLYEIHVIRLKNFQHERMIHFFVMLAVGLGLLICSCFMIAYSLTILYPISALLLALFIPYVVHYFNLENGVQHLYPLGQRIEEKLLSK